MDVVFSPLSLIQIIKPKFSFLLDLLNEKSITVSVYKEIIEKGKAFGVPDPVILDLFVRQGKIKVEEIRDYAFFREIIRTSVGEDLPLSIAEAESITLAKENQSILVSDEIPLRRIANSYRVPNKGFFFLLKLGYDEMKISKKVFKELTDELAFEWRIGAREYKEIHEEISRI